MRYNICPSELTALQNLASIEANLRRLGVLNDQNKFGQVLQVGGALGKNYAKRYHLLPEQGFYDQYGVTDKQVMDGVIIYQEVSEDPQYLMLDEYEIYNYLNDTAKTIWLDNTVIPHAIDYQVHVTPRLHRAYTFNGGGLLLSTKISHWDFDNNVEIKPILMITEQYTLTTAEPYPAARSVVLREKWRQWYRTDGTLKDDHLPVADRPDVKYTKKLYDDINYIRGEGKRRRDNITNNTSQGIVHALVVLHYAAITGGDLVEAQGLAENWLISLLSLLQNEHSNYLVTGRILAEAIEALSGSEWDTQFAINIPNIPEIQADPYASRGIGMTLKQYMVDSFKGLI